ncbi:MAG: hypothetical protein DWI12_05800 [Planctomycetota bacterium]|nr:MAG: hypothetical protein DWI12_05800 [Planctomycetota bacterium]
MARGEHEEITRLEQRHFFDSSDVAEKVNMLRDAQCFTARSTRLLVHVITSACDEHRDRRALFVQLCGSVDEMI